MRPSIHYIVRGLLLAAIILPSLLTIPVIAQTPTPITGCGTISQPGDYLINRDFSGSGSCLTIAADDVSIDGGGHTVTVSGGTPRLLDITNHQRISLTNITSNSGIQIYGDSAGHLTVDHANFDGVAIYSADDVAVRDSTLKWVSGAPIDRQQPVERLTLQRNTMIASDVLKMVLLVGGTTVENQTTYTCSRGDYLIEDNTITSNWPESAGDEPLVLSIRCSNHNIVRRNTLTATGKAVGIYLRDQSDYNTYEDNTIDVGQSWAGSLLLASGLIGCTAGTSNCPYGRPEPGDPAHNTFARNVFRARNSTALNIQSQNDGNVFSYNTFITNSVNVFPQSVTEETVTFAASTTFLHNTFYRINSGNPFRLATWENAGTANTFRDNIISFSGTSPYNLDHTSCTDMGTKYSADHNLFQNRGGSVSFGSCGATLAAWQGGYAGRDSGSITGDPNFSDTNTFDFSLQAGSPALNAASDGSNIGAWQSGACVENWSCGAFSSCANNTQSRTCTDLATCGTIINRPALTQACDSTAPTVSITSPANGATVSGTTSVTATASDNVGVVGVQFKLDGVNLGSEDNSAPYSISWNTTGASNAAHTLTTVARDAAGLTTTSSAITVTVNNVVVCTEDWVTIPCSAWSTCTNGTQTRTCTDANNCGTLNSRPTLTQSCTADSVPPAQVLNLQAS